MMKVSAVTVASLRSRLCTIAERVPAGVRADIESVIYGINEGTAVANLLCRR